MMSEEGPVDPVATDDADVPAHKPPPPSQGFGGGRFGAAGMPAEKSNDFAGSTRRLLAAMSPERMGAVGVFLAALVSVTLAVIGPRILGRGTDVIVDGLTHRTHGIQFDRLRNVLFLVVGRDGIDGPFLAHHPASSALNCDATIS